MRKQLYRSTMVGNKGRQLENHRMEGTEHSVKENELHLLGAGGGATKDS